MPDPRRRWRLRRGPVLVAPLVAALAVGALYPTLYTIALALTRSSLGRPLQHWVGLEQIATLLRGDYAHELLRTLLFVLPISLVQMALGLALALLLQQVRRGGGLLRSVILLPVMTPPVMVGIAWKLLLATEGGWINHLLLASGLTAAPVAFLATPFWAWIGLAVADTWQWTPFVAILCFAALQALPTEAREAAVLDGAGPWGVLRYVVLPQAAPALLAILLLRVVMAAKVFDLLVVLTFGGPGDATSFASFRIWRTAFETFDVGNAAAMTVLFGLLLALLTLPLRRLHDRAALRAG